MSNYTPPIVENIPAELTALNQWVIWRAETRNGKKETKIPYMAHNAGPAKSNDPVTWATFESAWQSADMWEFDGVGFVFSLNDPYVGIDLDDCIDDDGTIAEWADKIISEMNSYTEISPSGHGVKIWVKGEIPGSVKTESVEMYSHSRYFTVTGNQLPYTSNIIRSVNGELQALYDSVKKKPSLPAAVKPTVEYTTPTINDSHIREWVDRVFAHAISEVAAANDGNRHNTRIKQAKLLGGLIPLGYADAYQIESVLYAANPPEDNDENERKAIRAGIEYGKTSPLTPPEAPRQPVYDKSGYACCPIHKVRLPAANSGNGHKCHQPDKSTATEWCDFWWKGEGYAMPANSQTLTNSNDSRGTLNLSESDVIRAESPTPAKRGRFFPHTRADLDSVQEPDWLLEGEIVARAYNLIYGPSGSGKTFYLVDILRRASQIGFVVYIATEDTAGLKVRIMAQEKAHGVKLENMGWLDEPIDLANSHDVADLITDLSALSPVLVIIDTLAMAHSGDENSNQDMSVVNRAARLIIKETGAAVAVVHHTGINESRERGATSLMGNVDLKVKVTMDDELIVISQEKVRNGKAGDPRKFRLTNVILDILDKHGKPVESAVIRPATDVTMRGAKLTPRQRAALEALAQEVFRVAGAKGNQLMGILAGVPVSSFYSTMSKLIALGMVTQGTRGDPYFITGKGRDEIAPEYTPMPIDGYTPIGFESDSQVGIPQQESQFQDSQPTLESPAPLAPTLESRPTSTEPDSAFDFIPPDKRSTLRSYLRSGIESDQDRAKELCNLYDVDYHEALREVLSS